MVQLITAELEVMDVAVTFVMTGGGAWPRVVKVKSGDDPVTPSDEVEAA